MSNTGIWDLRILDTKTMTIALYYNISSTHRTQNNG